MSSSVTQDGIRAVSSEGTRFRSTTKHLELDNYFVWRTRIKPILVANELWDLVNDTIDIPRRADPNVFQTPEQADRQTAYETYKKNENRAGIIITESMSDSILEEFSSFAEDPVLLWQKLELKFNRKSEAAKSDAQLALLTFHHSEIETADQTILRFQKVVKAYVQQGVVPTEKEQTQSLMRNPNDRYAMIMTVFRMTENHDIEQLFQQMRVADDKYRAGSLQESGSAHRAEGRVKQTVDTRSVADQIADGISDGMAKMEVLWVQKYAKGSAKVSTGKAAAYTTCYCCNEKGHYSRDCPERATAKCNYCRKDGHLEKACKLKRDREPAANVNMAHGSFFLGGKNMAREGEINMARLVDFGEVCSSYSSTKDATSFLADSGASHHICCDRSLFTHLEPFKGKFKIMQVSGELEVTHWGSIRVEVDGKHGKEVLKLGNVLLLECMHFNIFSLQKARLAKLYYAFKELPGKVILKTEVADEQVALFTELEGRWTLDCKVLLPTSTVLQPQQSPQVLAASLSMDLLHRRMGHPGQAAIHRILREDMATGVGKVVGKVSPCDACQLGKLTRPPHPAVEFSHGTTRPLQLVVVDLAGGVQPCTLGGAVYILGILDVNTRYSWAYLLKKKSDAAQKLLEWKAIAENQIGHKLLTLRSDGGGEFVSTSFMQQMALAGVTLQRTTANSPESNGMAERWNRSVQDKTRTVMLAAALPGYLWGEVLLAINSIRNMSPVTNLGKTPFELWHGQKPDLS